MMNAHKRYYNIDKMEIKGELVDNHARVENHILDVYGNLFKEEELRRPDWCDKNLVTLV